MRYGLRCLLLFWFAGAVWASPHIVLIYVDDLGYGDLGVTGHPVIETPHLDTLANDGLLLTHYYAPSPLCSPSRAAVLTGRMPYRTGIKSWIPADTGIFLQEGEVTLPELLKGEGYATALIGKWHLNSDLGNSAEPQPRDHGFDYAYGNNAFQIPTNRNPTNLFRNGEALGEVEGYTAQLFVDEAMSWLDSQTGDQPFFVMLSMNEPHTTIENPPEFNARYAEYTDGEIVPIPSGEGIPYDKLIPRGPGEYYANITYLDHQLGRFLDYLDERGWRDDALVVFASDNGPVTESWIHWWEVNAYGSTGGFRARKHFLYEGGIRVPAMMRWPGRIPAGTSASVTVGMDLFVTLARIGGAEVPTDRTIDGIDLQPLFAGEKLERTEPLVWALPSPDGKEFAYRDGDWKLLLSPAGAPLELYNLERDPLEMVDQLAAEPERVARMQQGFDSWWQGLPSASRQAAP